MNYEVQVGEVVVFTAGEYSDYHIEGIYIAERDFNLQEKAKRYGYRTERQVAEAFQAECLEYEERLEELEFKWKHAHADDPDEPHQHRTKRFYRAQIDRTKEDRDLYLEPRLRKFSQDLLVAALVFHGYLAVVGANYMHRDLFDDNPWDVAE